MTAVLLPGRPYPRFKPPPHRVQDEPIRVEVITLEEIEEKALMRPGNVAMLVSETGGVRVQVTSPALGAANIRG